MSQKAEKRLSNSEWLAWYKADRAQKDYEFFDGPNGLNTLWPHQVWALTMPLNKENKEANEKELQQNTNWVNKHIPDYGKRWIQMGWGFRFRDAVDAQRVELVIKMLSPKGLNS